jgi:hypothetical protein
MLVPLAAVLVSGCGSGNNVVLRGTLQKDGKAYVFAEGEELEVSLIGQDPSGRAFSSGAEVNKETGTFSFKGPTGQGIPPGTYKITLSSQLFSGPQFKGDRFRGAFSQEKTPLSYAMTTDRGQEIIIDIGKKTVTTK